LADHPLALTFLKREGKEKGVQALNRKNCRLKFKLLLFKIKKLFFTNKKQFSLFIFSTECLNIKVLI